MAVLDLQGMTPKPAKPGVALKNSGASKGCVIGGGGGGGGSRLSLLLC